MTIYQAIEVEVAFARAKHPRPMNSGHEGYGVILEELDEAWEAIKTDHLGAMADELIQTAAMCVRTIEDLGLTWKVTK